MKKRNGLNITALIIILALAGIYYLQKYRKNNPPERPKIVTTDPKRPEPTGPADHPTREEGLNRRVARLIYTKHARCRMGCRHIDESEVKEILDKGTINYKKSELNDARGPKYAVEGVTHDNQRVRIVFTQDAEGTAVVTVIDLDTEWQCDCK